MRVLHWFRKGLRLHDNPALLACLNPPKKADGEETEIFFLYIYDATGKEYGTSGYRQAQFLFESLKDLDKSLSDLNANFRLLVAHGDPVEEVPALCKRLNIKFISFESEIEPYCVERDARVTKSLNMAGVSVSNISGNTMWDPELLRSKYSPSSTDGSSRKLGIPMTYQSFYTLVKRVSPQGPPKPLPSFSEYASSCSAPDLFQLDLGKVRVGLPESIAEVGNGMEEIPDRREHAADAEARKWDMAFPGGEREALGRLERTVEQRAEWIRTFAKPETAPTGLPISTTGLSPYLRLGCISSRRVWWSVAEAMKNKQIKSCKATTQPPVSMHGQLLWREFFHLVASVTPNYDQMEGNPICRQINWGKNPELLRAWSEGRTGFPFIDAAMIQLRRHGWIHHLARHSVACFLTRGQLWQSWMAGAEVFSRLLLDADWALNQSNWMWLSASAFFHQYHRVYCPVGFGKKTDKEGKFIRNFIPALRRMPAEYIYSPWTAPMRVQKSVGCIIGVDYPAPIIDYKEAREKNLARMKAAYSDKPLPTSRALKRSLADEASPAMTSKPKKSNKLQF